jgi:hypothetical protein
MANPPTTTLQDIQTKVRRLTRTPSTAQLSDNDINQYINTFVVYDFPEHLRMFNLRTQFTFYANPFQDVYPTDTISYFGTPAGGLITNPLYDFQNKYISVHTPVYIAGYQSFYSQSREQFFGIYPITNNISSIGPTGDGSTLSFTGVINSQQAILPPLSNFSQVVTLLQNNVLFSSVDNLGIGLALVDVPLTDAISGNKLPIGNLYVPNALPVGPVTVVTPNNTINYVTGAFTITFPEAPAAGVLINSQTVPQICALPQALMYYDNQFTLRPVPDQPYAINFEAYIRPTALLEEDQNPTLNDWWQYIAFGAAKKIFEDRMDMESVQMIMPEYKKQEALVQRRTIVQYTNERVATIYTEQVNYGAGSGGWGWANGL